MDMITTANLAAAALTAAAAGFAWRAARRSWQASEALAGIERARRHEELTPQFEVTLESPVGGGSDNPRLRVTLLGPVGLGAGLAELTVRIRDDRPREPTGLAGGPTAEQIAATLWGPFRFTPGSDGADELGRQVAPIALAMEESTLYQLERSRPAPWFVAGGWEGEFPVTKPVRLVLHCTAAGHDPWDVLEVVYARTAPGPAPVTAAAV